MPVEKGAEKGYFKFGGSSTVTLFERGRIELAKDLVETSQGGMELYARMGDLLGKSLEPDGSSRLSQTRRIGPDRWPDL